MMFIEHAPQQTPFRFFPFLCRITSQYWSLSYLIQQRHTAWLITHSSLQHYFALGFQVSLFSSSQPGVPEAQALAFSSSTPSLSAGCFRTQSSSCIFFLCTLTPLVTPSQFRDLSVIYVVITLKFMSTGRTWPLDPKPLYSMVTAPVHRDVHKKTLTGHIQSWSSHDHLLFKTTSHHLSDSELHKAKTSVYSRLFFSAQRQ